MAGTITHDKFARDVKTQLKKDLPINKELYRVASQGHDLGMFFKWYNLKLRGETHKFSLEVLQNSKFLDYIATYIKYIKDNKLEDNIDVKNYLYGYITHHYLDAFTHPYIIYKTGEYLNTPETEKYIGQHCLYETQIDKVFLDEFYNGKQIHKIFPKHINYDKTIESVNSYAFDKVYNNKLYGKYFVEAMNDIYPFLKIFRNDLTKIKLLGYKMLDLGLKTIKSGSRYEFLSYQIKNPYNLDDLFTTEYWNNPVDNKENHCSFMNLYLSALMEVTNIIEELENIITDTSKTFNEIYNVVDNKSAIHGYECDKNLKLKYFK